MSRFIEHSMNLDTVKHFQDDLYFRTEGVPLEVDHYFQEEEN